METKLFSGERAFFHTPLKIKFGLVQMACEVMVVQPVDRCSQWAVSEVMVVKVRHLPGRCSSVLHVYLQKVADYGMGIYPLSTILRGISSQGQSEGVLFLAVMRS